MNVITNAQIYQYATVVVFVLITSLPTLVTAFLVLQSIASGRLLGIGVGEGEGGSEYKPPFLLLIVLLEMSVEIGCRAMNSDCV